MTVETRSVTFIVSSETKVDGILLPPGEYHGIERRWHSNEDEAPTASEYQMNLTEQDVSRVRGLKSFRGAIIDATPNVKDGSLKVF
jgi:hypothetical protein